MVSAGQKNSVEQVQYMKFLSQVTRLPPATHVLRPERDEDPLGPLERISREFTGRFIRLVREHNSGFSGFLSRVDRHGKTYRENLLLHALELTVPKGGNANDCRGFSPVCSKVGCNTVCCYQTYFL